MGRLQEASERRRQGNGCEGLWLAGRGLREGWPQLLAHSTLHHPQDLGLEGTLLTDILYRNVAFLNLVDPISHDLLVNLACDLQCPKTVRPAGKDLRLGGVIDRPGEPRAGGSELGSLSALLRFLRQVTAPLWDLMPVSVYYAGQQLEQV